MNSRYHFSRFVGLASFLLIGCGLTESDSNKEIPLAKAPPIDAVMSHNSTVKASQASTVKLYGGVKFEFPSGWEEKALSNAMILAEFSLPGEAGPGRLTLSTASGGMAANIDRWKSQFQRGAGDSEPNESKVTAAGKEATLIEVSGSYSDMFGGSGPKPNWQLLGVVIPIDSQHNYFVKLTGPRPTISARRDEFLKFVASAKFE